MDISLLSRTPKPTPTMASPSRFRSISRVSSENLIPTGGATLMHLAAHAAQSVFHDCRNDPSSGEIHRAMRLTYGLGRRGNDSPPGIAAAAHSAKLAFGSHLGLQTATRRLAQVSRPQRLDALCGSAPMHGRRLREWPDCEQFCVISWRHHFISIAHQRSPR